MAQLDEKTPECFEVAVRACIMAGGCCASRASFVGACIGARLGVAAIPPAWLAQTLRGTEILSLATELVELRGDTGAGLGTPPLPPGNVQVVDATKWRPSSWAGL